MKEPPSIPLPPMGVRYPLYADELADLPAESTAEQLFLPDELPDDELPDDDLADDLAGDLSGLGLADPAPPAPRRRAAWLAVAAAALVLLVIAALGLQLLRGHHHAASASSPRPSGGAKAPATLKATAEAPATAQPGKDTAGHATAYTASNMLDGDPTTAWRMPGDGSGTTLTFTLQHPATITSLGIVNGYAKTEGGMDWYAGNRRVTEVTWHFDDGRALTQQLRDVRTLQTIKVPSIHTSTVRLTLTKVTAPGQGASRRDMTAVSEVAIHGVTER